MFWRRCTRCRTGWRRGEGAGTASATHGPLAMRWRPPSKGLRLQARPCRALPHSLSPHPCPQVRSGAPGGSQRGPGARWPGEWARLALHRLAQSGASICRRGAQTVGASVEATQLHTSVACARRRAGCMSWRRCCMRRASRSGGGRTAPCRCLPAGSCTLALCRSPRKDAPSICPSASTGAPFSASAGRAPLSPASSHDRIPPADCHRGRPQVGALAAGDEGVGGATHSGGGRGRAGAGACAPDARPG